jgi:multidrug efflux pump subunit AcrA (membrane-fusion protein)
VFAALWSCKGSAPKEAGAEVVTPVQTGKALQEPIERVISAEAVLDPIRHSSITPKINAPVKHFLVNRGDHVHEGQLLAQLESQDLRAASQESRALYEQSQSVYKTMTRGTLPEDMTKARTDLQNATQGLEAAKRLYENRVALVKEGALAQKLADDARVAYSQAQSQFDVAQGHLNALESVSREEQVKSVQDQVDAAKAHWLSSEAQVSYSEIRSPISGVVSDRPASDGEMANSGSPLITIVDISQIIARVNVPASDVQFLKVGEAATIHGAGEDVEGKVWVVSPGVDPSSTTVEVWVKAPNTGERLKPGTTAKIDIHAQTIKDAIVIPDAALLAGEEGEDKVIVITPDSTAQIRKVKTGVRQDGKVQILEGVKAGESVVTVGGVGLDDNAKVQVENAKAHD